mmetsp:Transcript_22243/g.50104  ORF Transcript_22243/g.50104 Transcript_22243/m.50104 type:complete len:209 (+) Transcript_22243:345-971(+)
MLACCFASSSSPYSSFSSHSSSSSSSTSSSSSEPSSLSPSQSKFSQSSSSSSSSSVLSPSPSRALKSSFTSSSCVYSRTVILRPASSASFKVATACFCASSVAKTTKPVPRDFPLERPLLLIKTRAATTSPHEENICFNISSSTSYAKLPTWTVGPSGSFSFFSRPFRPLPLPFVSSPSFSTEMVLPLYHVLCHSRAFFTDSSFLYCT